MWAAVEALAARYRADNPELSVAQSRADALTDLVLTDVQVSTTATLIIPTASAQQADPTRRRPIRRGPTLRRQPPRLTLTRASRPPRPPGRSARLAG